MAIFTIKKGAHYSLRSMIGLFYKREAVSKLVRFDKSCKYRLEGEDHFDTNKLFGIGYFWSHKTDSARFGWRYNEITGNIMLSAYCYVNKKRIIYPICEVKFDEWATLTILIYDNEYHFVVDRTGKNPEHELIKKKHKKKWGFPLGVYFGGQKTSPHNMKVEIIKHD